MDVGVAELKFDIQDWAKRRRDAVRRQAGALAELQVFEDRWREATFAVLMLDSEFAQVRTKLTAIEDA